MSAGARLDRDYRVWTFLLVAVLSSPLLLAALLAWGMAVAAGPALGGAAFCLGIAVWLPLFAVGLTNACAQLAGAEQ